MKVKSITVGADIKVTRNYSSVASNFQMTVDLEEGDDAQDCHNQLVKTVWQMLDDDIHLGIGHLLDVKE